MLYVLDPATHGALTNARGSLELEHPVTFPFEELGTAVSVDNPIAQSLMQLAFFFESYRACPSEMPRELCSASVVAPGAP